MIPTKFLYNIFTYSIKPCSKSLMKTATTTTMHRSHCGMHHLCHLCLYLSTMTTTAFHPQRFEPRVCGVRRYWPHISHLQEKLATIVLPISILPKLSCTASSIPELQLSCMLGYRARQMDSNKMKQACTWVLGTFLLEGSQSALVSSHTRHS